MGISSLVALFALVAMVSGGVSNEANFTRQILAEHNRARKAAKSSMAPVQWDAEIASVAQKWAERCVFAHSSGSGYGENIYASWGKPVDKVGDAASKAWNSEKKDYTYKNNKCARGKVCGHYTQVVWETSVKVGCGYQHCEDKKGMDFVVCNYSPPGNWRGKKPY